MRTRFDKLLLPPASGPAGLIRKLITLVLAILLIGLGLMFSAVLLAALVVVVAIGGAWFWWKTRKLRKQIKQQLEENGPQLQRMMQGRYGQPQQDNFKGEIIEGEVIRKEHESLRL